MEAIIGEIFLTADAHAIPLHWKTADDYLNHFYSRLVPPTAGHYPSMYYDLKAGKRLEIDALNGAVVRLAKQKGRAGERSRDLPYKGERIAVHRPAPLALS